MRRASGHTRLLFAALALSACHKDKQPEPQPSPPHARASATPVDRLAPGELAPGEAALFGLPLPRGMRVQGQFERMGMAYGELDPENVASYVRTRVVATQVEIGAARTIFPSARVHTADGDHPYRIEVLRDGNGTRLVMHDLTPAPPPPKVEGLTDAERWRRAGFSPDGKPLNLKALE